jgi:hypothetical protein
MQPTCSKSTFDFQEEHFDNIYFQKQLEHLIVVGFTQSESEFQQNKKHIT